MSALAKVFVVFICILSVAFFGTSATLYKTRMDWRKAFEQLKATTDTGLATVEKRNSELLRVCDKREQDLIQVRASENGLANDVRKLNTDLETEKKKVSESQGVANNAVNLAQQHEKSLQSEKTRYDTLNQALTQSKTDREEALTKLREANENRDRMRLDLEKTQQELHESRASMADLTGRYESQELLLAEAKKLLGPKFPTMAMRDVPAVVKAYDAKEKLVLLSVGKDQEVELGYEFTVYRGDEFIGKVKVIKVFPDVCGAEVLFTKEGAEIQRGDKARTSTSI